MCKLVFLIFLIIQFEQISHAKAEVLSPESDKICLSPSCIKLAAEVLDFIDPTQDPCQDFFNFVCGNFLKTAFIDGTPSPIRRAMNKFENQVNALVVDPIEKNDTKPVIQMKKFYDKCMNTDRDEWKLFLKLLNQLGGWPILKGVDWKEDNFSMVEYAVKGTNIGIDVFTFLGYGKEENVANEEFVLTVFVNNFEKSLSRIEAEKKLLTYLLDNKFVGHITDQMMDDINKTMELAEELSDMYNCNTFESECYRSPDRMLQCISGEFFNLTLQTFGDLEKDFPTVPWEILIRQGLGVNITKKHLISLQPRECLDDFKKVFQKTNKRTLANFVMWNTFLKYINLLGPEFSAAYQKYIVVPEEDKTETRHKICISETAKWFENVKEIEYIRKNTAEAKIRQDVLEMVNNIEEVFKDLLQKNDWMDAETKAKGVEKVNKMIKIIGATPDIYNATYFDKILGVDNFEFKSKNIINMTIERKLKMRTTFASQLYENSPDDDYRIFFEYGTKLNAYYVFDFNVVFIPAAILQSIFYQTDAPKFKNYGAMGRIIGHEILHGFSKRTSAYKLVNKTKIVWWDQKTDDAFDKKVECLIKDYESFFPNNTKTSGDITLEENLGDLVGIDAAYLAYQKWVQTHGGEKMLPALNFTARQLFWIEGCTPFCFKKLDSDEFNMETSDVHGWPRYRINGGIKNSRYFAKDFHCAEGSPLNPKNKCQIF